MTDVVNRTDGELNGRQFYRVTPAGEEKVHLCEIRKGDLFRMTHPDGDDDPTQVWEAMVDPFRQKPDLMSRLTPGLWTIQAKPL